MRNRKYILLKQLLSYIIIISFITSCCSLEFESYDQNSDKAEIYSFIERIIKDPENIKEYCIDFGCDSYFIKYHLEENNYFKKRTEFIKNKYHCNIVFFAEEEYNYLNILGDGREILTFFIEVGDIDSEYMSPMLFSFTKSKNKWELHNIFINWY